MICYLFLVLVLITFSGKIKNTATFLKRQILLSPFTLKPGTKPGNITGPVYFCKVSVSNVD
jgi:hypothetical protein